ncbi:phosphonate ABC transporter substrate-binidng protein [Candidatus Nitromaritima sp. SCGC AAA799-A02]|nr:phosphonate ABC transporter substrate-binidng protein [Candidatus Nitromaritima sp. SCGC AAA799-A02]KMP11521.1 phosphonate ABC transporter substrate-binidng protein [Candidatus Nitromaritima sp. SCGC AAA799-C22]
MKSRIFLISLAVIGWACLVDPAGASSRGSLENPLRMMFVPSGDSQVILKGGEEIARRLEQVTGLHIKTSVATSYAAVIEAMGAGKVDIGWLATFSYVLAREKYGVDLLLIVVRFGSPFYRGQIMAAADRGIDKLADLKGKTFAFVDPASTSGHLYPKSLLLSKGHDPETFFDKSVFAGSHNAVVLSILKGEVDAGAAYDDARAAVAKSFPEVFDKVKIIAYTREIPNDVVAVRKDLEPGLKRKVKEGLIHISKTPDGARVLKKVYGISGLADLDAFFDPVREAGRRLGLDMKKLHP